MNSMLQANEIINLLLMERAAGDGRVVIAVEGEGDCAFLDIHVNRQRAKTQLAGSKSAVLGASEIAHASQIDWIAFLVDADQDRHNGKSSTWPSGVIGTTLGDLFVDATLETPEVLRSVLHNRGMSKAIKLEQWTKLPIDQFCYETALLAGAVRSAVIDGELGISAKRWRFPGLIPAVLGGDSPLSVVSSEAVRRSRGKLKASEVEQSVGIRLSASFASNKRYLNDHDILAAAAEIVTYVSGRTIRSQDLAETCLVAFRCDGFTALSAIQEIRQWSLSTHAIDPFNCALAA